MKLWDWLPVVKPRNSVQTVIRELIDGLNNGSIVLEKNMPPVNQPPRTLVLSREKNERIVINNDITIAVVEIRGDKVRLEIIAPKDMPVDRQEAAAVQGIE